MSAARSLRSGAATASRIVGEGVRRPPTAAGSETICIRRSDGCSTPLRLHSHLQFRGKRTAAAARKKNAIRKAVSSSASRGGGGGGAGGEGLINAEGQFPYGLRPVDYSIPPPIYRAPPPPPSKPGMRKYIFPASLAVTFAVTAYFYVNNKNDAYEYWEAMQTGAVPLFDDDDDDDEDFDDEEEEE
eukprot:CAMPEP_0113575796 /NCGR_PEP_ID=MMETSP0015_2-20120614/27905_1 /TAXON_ID=2838 /ORGANISM="Odontella" /LENGTH=185 /DNA_ID=CAMNT_0000479091 /DNA_START=138 /DNA_END=695 /DNA_ORIENTATION=+ /assembly_acc=CAM_ASM_000160